MSRLHNLASWLRWLTVHAQPRRACWKLRKFCCTNRPLVIPFDEDQHIRVWSRDMVGEAIYVHGMFEKALYSVVFQHIKPGMVFFDIGAHLGQHTLLAAKRVGPEGSVHSFEPQRRMFAELAYNVRINGHTNVHLNRVAISGSPGKARITRYEPGKEVFGTLARQGLPGRPLGYEEVMVTTLDAYVTENKIERVDMIKVDVEGAELPALKGAHLLLAGPHPPLIVLEIVNLLTREFGYYPDDIYQYLRQFGYILEGVDRRSAKRFPVRTSEDFRKTDSFLAIVR